MSLSPCCIPAPTRLTATQPILKEVHDAPMEFRFRSDTLALTVECLIKAIEARTMDTGIPEYKIPSGVERSELPRYEHERQVYLEKVDAAKWVAVHHDMTQGFVLTQYFYEQLLAVREGPRQPERHDWRDGLRDGRRSTGASCAPD